ncbi:MAG: succinylglutamate desuccinylase [Bacteroidetes bacterium]|nr:MAG: succinylglutamate desuccinylase [Bacteroidota bacterium]
MQDKEATNIPPDETNALTIAGYEVLPGDKTIIGLNVGSLPSDTKIYINVFVFRGEEPGPVMLVLGGIHGDEINGIEIVRRSIESGVYKQITKGTVIAIPLLNVFGFINFSRDVHDGKDVNRSFPGNSKGSLASRVAHALTNGVLPVVDFGIDFHTGGRGRFNYPQLRCTTGSEESFKLARIFGAPYIVEKPVINKSLREVSGKMDIPMIVYESGESQRLDGHGINFGFDGILNVMRAHGMIDPVDPVKRQEQVLIRKSAWIRASASGIFTWTKKSGEFVQKGEPLGTIKDLFVAREEVISSKRSGYIIGHTNTPVVSHGDALFHIGYDFEILEE